MTLHRELNRAKCDGVVARAKIPAMGTSRAEHVAEAGVTRSGRSASLAALATGMLPRRLRTKATGGPRLVGRAVRLVGRQNGEFAITAALVMAKLVGSEAIRNWEIRRAATGHQEARSAVRNAAQVMRVGPELLTKSMLTCRHAVAGIPSCVAPNGPGCQP